VDARNDVAVLASQTGTIDAEDLVAETASVRLWSGPPVPVKLGVLDKAAEHAFMNGQCHALALALAEKLDKPLFVLAIYEYSSSDEWWDEDGDMDDAPSEEWLAAHWSHAVLQLGWDSYLDVTGVSSEDELMEVYGDTDEERGETGNVLFAVTPKQLERFWMYGYGVAPDMDVARTFVEPVLDLAGVVAI